MCDFFLQCGDAGEKGGGEGERGGGEMDIEFPLLCFENGKPTAFRTTEGQDKCPSGMYVFV